MHKTVRIDEKRLDIAMIVGGIRNDSDLSEKSKVDQRTILNVRRHGTCTFKVWNQLAGACGVNPIDLLITTGYPDPKWEALVALSV